MTRLRVRNGITLAGYLESVGASIHKVVVHLPGWRPIAVDLRKVPPGGSARLFGKSADDWLCTETAFEFGDGRSLITAHVWAKPRPPAAPVDVPVD